MAKAAKRLFICLDNGGYEISLERLKIYVALRDAKAERIGYLRIIDQSGSRTCTRVSALSRPNSQSRHGARSYKRPSRWFERDLRRGGRQTSGCGSAGNNRPT